MKKYLIEYSWVLMILFFIITIIDYRFGVLALICMMAPIYYALIGQGKKGCTVFCPRGAFLNKLKSVSSNKVAPKWMFHNITKILVFVIIMSVFIVGTIQAWGSLSAVGFVFLRMLIISTIVAIFLGVFFKERTWCVICPMGNVANEIIKSQNKKKTQNLKK